MDKTKVNSIDELRKMIAAKELSDDELTAVSGGGLGREDELPQWQESIRKGVCMRGVTQETFPCKGKCLNFDTLDLCYFGMDLTKCTLCGFEADMATVTKNLME